MWEVSVQLLAGGVSPVFNHNHSKETNRLSTLFYPVKPNENNYLNQIHRQPSSPTTNT